jgi:hypothetical protein
MIDITLSDFDLISALAIVLSIASIAMSIYDYRQMRKVERTLQRRSRWS